MTPLVAIERDNPALKDVLPKDYARPALDKQRPGQLIDMTGNIQVGDAEARSRDVLGRVYEYGKLDRPIFRRECQGGDFRGCHPCGYSADRCGMKRVSSARRPARTGDFRIPDGTRPWPAVVHGGQGGGNRGPGSPWSCGRPPGPVVPFTDSRAGRDIRMAKVRQGVSGRFGSPEHADACRRISSYLKSTGRMGYNPPTAIRTALGGDSAETVGDGPVPARWTRFKTGGEWLRNSKDVQIVTFDELLEKLVQLRELLVSSNDGEDTRTLDTDLPF